VSCSPLSIVILCRTSLLAGVAVNLLGYERMTADVDVLVPASRA
jgi:hypothetical protein